jgi:hypothetical protein
MNQKLQPSLTTTKLNLHHKTKNNPDQAPSSTQ